MMGGDDEEDGGIGAAVGDWGGVRGFGCRDEVQAGPPRFLRPLQGMSGDGGDQFRLFFLSSGEGTLTVTMPAAVAD
jgi:hypothetical protein